MIFALQEMFMLPCKGSINSRFLNFVLTLMLTSPRKGSFKFYFDIERVLHKE